VRAERSILSCLFVGAALAGCASTSIRDDVERIRSRVRLPVPGEVADRDVDPDPSREVARVLASPLTADGAVRLAMANNRQMRATLRELGIPRGRVLQAGLLPNPAVEFDLRYQQDRSQPLQGDVSVEFALTRALLAPVRASVARAELDAARVRAAGAAIELGFDVRTAFYAVQAAQERLEIGQRGLDAFAAGRDAARAVYAAGNVAEFDLAGQEATYEASRITVAQLELELLDRRERLVRLLGLFGNETTWTVQGGLAAAPGEAPVREATEARAVRASLELEALRTRLEVTARRTGLSRAEGWTPDITIDAHGEQDGNSLEIGGGARVTLPVFDRRQGQTAAYEAEFDGMLERYHGLAIDVRSALRELRNRVRSAHARARAYDAVIGPARRRVLEQTVLQYNAMNVGLFQVLQARREQLDAELARVETRREYWAAAAALDALLAGWRVETERAFAAPAAMNGGGGRC
jgi:cobalt-zinc-cadmium efflux system outer membrane protein